MFGVVSSARSPYMYRQFWETRDTTHALPFPDARTCEERAATGARRVCRVVVVTVRAGRAARVLVAAA